jgi:hypothetical protein
MKERSKGEEKEDKKGNINLKEEDKNEEEYKKIKGKGKEA